MNCPDFADKQRSLWYTNLFRQLQIGNEEEKKSFSDMLVSCYGLINSLPEK